MLGGTLCHGSALKEHPLEYCMSASCCAILSTLYLTLYTLPVLYIYVCVYGTVFEIWAKGSAITDRYQALATVNS
jgi:hypothetical protein